jgi:hypothetical protein
MAGMAVLVDLYLIYSVGAISSAAREPSLYESSTALISGRRHPRPVGRALWSNGRLVGQWFLTAVLKKKFGGSIQLRTDR